MNELRATGWHVVVVAPHSYRGSMTWRYLRLAVDALRAAGGVDGIEAHVAIPAGSIAAVVATLRRRPLVVVAHGSDVAYTAWRHATLTALARWTFRVAAAVVSNSRATADLVERLGGRSRIIPPGIDMDLWRPGPAERAELGLPPGRLALYVGPAELHKGADLFRAGVIASDWIGVLIGTGHEPDPTQRLLVLPPMDQPALARYVRSVDCVVMPSRREGLGLVAIEAASCGIPVVASPVGGLADIVRHGISGLLMTEASANQVTACLGRIATMSFDRAELRNGVRRYDSERTARDMAELWRDVLGGAAPPVHEPSR